MAQTSRDSIKRSVGLDLIRTLAILLVICGHFFLNTEFNKTSFQGVDMFFLSMVQTLSLINVSLFLMLTGYLNLNKRISKKYYLGGVRVIVTYLLIAAITGLFRRFYLGEPISFVKWILATTEFSIIPYGWYVEMWIGLFLLTPFLNLLWTAVENKKHRQYMIATLFLLVALPDFFNRYGVSLVPGYWVMLFPILFFYMGAYVKEYKPHYSKGGLLALIIGLCLINPLANQLLSFFIERPMLHLIGSGHGIIGVPLTALVFLLLYDIDRTKASLSRLLKRISVLSLDMYLISWLFDKLVYAWVNPIFTTSSGVEWLLIFIMAVPMVFLLSFLVSNVTYWVEKWMCHRIVGT